MARVVHHPHPSFETSNSAYWVAGIILALLALYSYFSVSGTHVASTVTESTMPFMPLM